VHNRVDTEGLSKITNVLVILGGSEEWDWVPFQFFQRPREYGTWKSKLGHPHVELIEHLRNPPQVPGTVLKIAET
jgi:hypothetical protein